MRETLIAPGIMRWQEKDSKYEIAEIPGLYLQQQKCNLQFFDSAHSIAGLSKFQKEIEKNASDFATLPMEGDDSPVEQVAYDLLYDGSVNKLRNVKEIATNRWELAHHLSKQAQLFLVAEGKLNPSLKSEILKFFKGRNSIDYWDMWEHVLAFLVIVGNGKAISDFCDLINNELRRLKYEGHPSISDKVRDALKSHLSLCLELCEALTGKPGVSTSRWRKSNLIRHHFVSIPLLNFTHYKGDLTRPQIKTAVKLSSHKVKNSPRYVHFDELMGLIDSGSYLNANTESIEHAQQLFNDFHGFRQSDVTSTPIHLKLRSRQ